MTKTNVSPKKPRKTVKKGRKRGPKEERLVITEDPAEALPRLLNPPKKPAR
jgi:hypothetical protein